MFRKYVPLSLALALVLAVGCHQAPVATPTEWGITVHDAPAASKHPPEALTGPRDVPADSYLPRQLLVRLAEGADAAVALEGFERFGEISLGDRIVGLRIPEGMSLVDAHARLLDRPGVTDVSLNWRQRPSASYVAPNDTLFGSQWAHQVTEAKALWGGADPVKNLDASKVIVAVLDTGLDVTHPEFAQRVVAAADFSVDPSRPSSQMRDTDGHGTHCAGIIGAAGNNATGVAGLAWDVNLMPVKVLGEQGGTDFGILSGFVYALGLDSDGNGLDDDGYRKVLPQGKEDCRTRIISMSLGSSYQGRSPFYDFVFAEARKRGVMVVVASGNDGAEVCAPANSPDCLSVSSTSRYQVGEVIWEWLSGFSNRGDRIDVAAPGGQIYSTVPTYANSTGTTSYATMSGTSMACPYVAGLAALLVAKHDPSNTRLNAAFHDQVRQHIMATSDDLGALGRDDKYGHGRVNVRRAVTSPFPAQVL